MRTTVTIEDDIERLLRNAMHQRGDGFKRVLNDALRRGLADVTDDADDAPFRVRPQDMGLRAGLDTGRLNAMADELEIDAHVDLTRRLLDDGSRA